MVFHGFPVGPFRGIGDIAHAFADSPPDAELVLSEARELEDCAVPRYAWIPRDDPDGEIVMRTRDGKILSIEITRN